MNDFEKTFNVLKISMPRDKYTVLVNTEAEKDEQSCAKFMCEVKVMIQENEKQLEKVNNIIPSNQMAISLLRNQVRQELSLLS